MLQVEDHNISLNRPDAYSRNRGESGSQTLRIVVILLQPVRHFFKRDQSGRSQNARLTHPSAQTLPIQPPLIHQLSRPHQHRPNRRPQPEPQTDDQRVAHAVVYLAGWPFVRTLIFVLGWICVVGLFVEVVR